MKTNSAELKSIRRNLIGFIVLLVLSGITAFPIQTELSMIKDFIYLLPNDMIPWFNKVFIGVTETNKTYPFISYGSDWLAFAHIILAIFFIGPFIDPVRNIWVLISGMIACILVFPLAFICGSIRGIPIWWQLIDCSFGVGGLIILGRIYLQTKKLNTNY